jgi:hypothetical protein
MEDRAPRSVSVKHGRMSDKAFYATGAGQKRLMLESVGMSTEHLDRKIVKVEGQDYGADPIGDGTFRMVPSGDIVDYDERMRRLPR